VLIVGSKAIPLQAWTGPEGSRKLRVPDFVTTAQDGGRLSALRTGRFYPPGNDSAKYQLLYIYVGMLLGIILNTITESRPPLQLSDECIGHRVTSRVCNKMQ